METYNLIVVNLFGLAIGSFLSVCIYRLPRKLSVVQPLRSFCPSCNTQLTWRDNIPLFSWVLLGGKCRHCRQRISERYPLVEVLSAAAASASYFEYGLGPTGILVYALSATLIVISFIDLDFKIIPNVITFPGMTLGLCLGIVSEYTSIFSPPITSGALDSLIGFLLGGGIFYVIGLFYYLATKREGLGGGDIKLLGMTGAILGWKSVLPTIFIGSLLGGVAGIFIIIFCGGGRKSEIPFGPWLAIGVLLYVFAHLQPFRI